MTTPAVTIADAITFCADNIAQLSYDGVVSIKTRMNAWIAAIFETAGVFPPANVVTPNQRRVIDWRAPSMMANDKIEGPLAGQSGLVGTSAVIDAVIRVLCAVRDAFTAGGPGAVTAAQRTATITAFNAQWT